jgi:hypothetical protein
LRSRGPFPASQLRVGGLLETFCTTGREAAISVVVRAVAFLLLFHFSNRLTVKWTARADIVATPFTAEVHHFRGSAQNGTGELYRTGIVARDRNGSTVEISTAGPLSAGQSAKNITFANGVRLNLFDLINGRTSWRLSTSAIAAMKRRLSAPPPDCMFGIAGERVVRHENLFGQDSIVLESSNGGMQVTAWRVPMLGCEELQYTLDNLAEGKRTTARVVSLRLGDPDAQLFDVRSDYTEMRPSDAYRRFKEKIGLGTISPMEDDLLRKKDGTYGSGPSN